MQYMGSKRRIQKQILPIILKERKQDQWFVDIFGGSGSIIENVDGKRIYNDKDKYIYACLQAIQLGWIPPTELSKDEYYRLKNEVFETLTDFEKGFYFYGCSFGGKYRAGYAFNSKGRNYALTAHNSLLKQKDKLNGVVFCNADYKDIPLPPESIIYCDPPYKGTSGYNHSIDHEEFWQWCRDRSNEGHKVYISEYEAPEDFICIWSKDINHNLNNRDGRAAERRVEKLFIYEG